MVEQARVRTVDVSTKYADGLGSRVRGLGKLDPSFGTLEKYVLQINAREGSLL